MSRTLAVLTDERGGGLAPRAWATLTWGDVELDGPTVGTVRLPSGRETTLGVAQVEALGVLLRWCRRAQSGRPPAKTDAVLSSLPGRAEFIGLGWIEAIVGAGNVSVETYLVVRKGHEAELAAGVSSRRAWERARGRLTGDEPAPPGPRGPKTKLGRVPVELREAYLQLGANADLSPATARVYRVVLLRVFERSDGQVPGAATLDRVLDTVAGRFSYASGARSAWRALARSAAVTGIELPLPEVRTGGGGRRRP